MAETWFDLPFFYVFDGQGLVDGARYENLSLPVQSDAEFRLRAIHGISRVGELLNFVDPQGKQVLRGVSASITNPLLIVPDMVFEPGSSIRFGIANVSRAFSLYLDGITREYQAKIVFAGVKRFRGAAADQLLEMHYPSSFSRYRLSHYCHKNSFTVDWRGKVAPAWTQAEPPRQFQFEIDDRGLEVYATQWMDQNGDLVDHADVEIMPYDLSGRALANDYVPVDAINYRPGWEEQLFPVAPLYWPPRSVVRLGIRSVMTDASSPYPLELGLLMIGARRIPC